MCSSGAWLYDHPQQLLNSLVDCIRRLKLLVSLYSQANIPAPFDQYEFVQVSFFHALVLQKNQKLLRVAWSYTLKVLTCKPDQRSEVWTVCMWSEAFWRYQVLLSWWLEIYVILLGLPGRVILTRLNPGFKTDLKSGVPHWLQWLLIRTSYRTAVLLWGWFWKDLKFSMLWLSVIYVELQFYYSAPVNMQQLFCDLCRLWRAPLHGHPLDSNTLFITDTLLFP